MGNNKALKTLFTFNGIFVFASTLFGPLYAVFVETIDNDVLHMTISWSAFLVSTTVFVLVVRKFGDLIQETEYLLMAGYLIRAIVWFVFPSITTFLELIVLQILLGIGEALGTPSYDALVAEHLDKNRHIEEYSNWKLISNIVGAIAVVIGGFIVKSSGFQVLFYLMGILALISFIGILIKPRKLL